ncbi:extracellular solute-binding protein [Paracoccus sp. MBLB3053]|uniref:Extracellular solute-binding protein n=1 Tax=Paracoccus aurantius TaxID=3073814 RepID=A0ABU2HUJ4_9RHOB|nr:extracellular solute-binding protein [Paracoccus sp. MBLB3053]MDS9468721.1 extracellular solute-binding protein [Paracoccus sp. MBLB3053]
MNKFLPIALMVAASASMASASTEIRVLRVQPSAKEGAFYERVEKAFEEKNPDVDVVFEYIANEAYKSKLPTLLQSSTKPDLFYSWGGQTLVEQTKAGFLADISGAVSDEVRATFPEPALAAYTVDGALRGLPLYATEVAFWVNTELTEKAGVDYTTIKTWDDFLAAVQKIKDAGITPIMAGGQDKWPLHFYWSYLALREGGADAINKAMQGEEGGFSGEAFVKAGADFQKLTALEPFQPGYMATTYEVASGMFADGKAAFHLMGDWDYGPMRARSQSGKGLPDEQLAFMAFPAIGEPVTEGGAGATLGGMNGWAVTADADPKASEFLTFMLNLEHQKEIGSEGIFVPIVKGAETSLTNPFFQRVAADIAGSTHHQIFLDQYLGASVGATVNDISADLAQGVIAPEDAAAQVQEAWEFR